MRQPVGCERLAFAFEHGVDRLDQVVNRNAVGIVVAADKAVFGEPRPSRGRRWQSRREQWSVVELG